VYRKGSLFVYSHPSDKKLTRLVFTVAFIPDDDDGFHKSFPSRTLSNAEALISLLFSAHVNPSRVARLRTLLETAGAGLIEDLNLSEEILQALELM